MERFAVNYNNQAPVNLTTELIGHFSIDSDLEYHADLSQLKYYKSPSNPDNVNFDLNVNSMSTHHKPTSHIGLENILRWICDNFHRIEKPLSAQEERWLDVDFVCSFKTIRKILCSPYNAKSDEWVIRASKYRDTIYLCEFYPDKRERGQDNATVSEKKISSGINKFQQYLVADHPSHKPDLSVPLNECGAFHCTFKANFGNYSLLYDAEIDAISSEQLIKDTLIGKTFELIGLKTFRMRGGSTHSTPGIVSKCWSKNYLVNTNIIVVGFKDTTNTVKMIKEYSVDDLLKLSKPSCDVEKCKHFLNLFLSTVKAIVTENHDKCIYKFHWKPIKDYIIYDKEAPDNEMYHFLKPWFVDKAEEYKRAQ